MLFYTNFALRIKLIIHTCTFKQLPLYKLLQNQIINKCVHVQPAYMCISITDQTTHMTM